MQRHSQNRREGKTPSTKTRNEATGAQPQASANGAGRMKTAGRTVTTGIAERLAARITNSQPAPTGLSAREYVLRRVELSSVRLRRVELQSVSKPSVSNQSVSSECVSHRASAALQPAVSLPRLELAHVFACLKAVAAKSRVLRLVHRTSRQRPREFSPASVGGTWLASA